MLPLCPIFATWLPVYTDTYLAIQDVDAVMAAYADAIPITRITLPVLFIHPFSTTKSICYPSESHHHFNALLYPPNNIPGIHEPRRALTPKHFTRSTPHPEQGSNLESLVGLV